MKAELYVTTYCEGGCAFCFGQGDFGRRGRHVPIEALLHRAQMLLAFHRRHPLHVVPLLGGEPLTHPELPILAARFGRELPMAVVSAGLPDTRADLDVLLREIRLWGATYNPHLCDRFVALVERLLRAGLRVEASMHFTDFDSFRSVNVDFLERAVARLPLDASWATAFGRYVEAWTPLTYHASSATPFTSRRHAAMTVRYSAIDTRFSPGAPATFVPLMRTDGQPFPCHLFSEWKAVAISEDGRLLPCTSNAQRHAAPVIADLDRYGRLPEDLPNVLEDLARQLEEATGERTCSVRCRSLAWCVDGPPRD